MRWDCVYEGENLSDLSARLQVPACMLMRANRIYSPAWLLPGRQIVVPDRDFCWWDDGICPIRAIKMKAKPYRSNEEFYEYSEQNI